MSDEDPIIYLEELIGRQQEVAARALAIMRLAVLEAGERLRDDRAWVEWIRARRLDHHENEYLLVWAWVEQAVGSGDALCVRLFEVMQSIVAGCNDLTDDELPF